MANLIIIRLHPDKPVPGGDFTNFLVGLTITAYDLSTGDPKIGHKIGDATYVAPPNPAQPWLPDPATRIVQHFSAAVALPPTLPQSEAVATAAIEVNLPGYKEYVRSDLRIEISRGGVPIFVKDVRYDVVTASGAINAPAAFPNFGASEVSVYVKLPRPTAAGGATLQLSDDGSPPNFDALQTAVQAVLAADQGPIPALGAISPAQARHIAYEIIWGMQGPLPAPPGSGSAPYDAFGAMYSNPPNDGAISNPLEQNRQQFEGNLSGYYAIQNANVDRLTRYVFALGAAIACEAASANAATALLHFPANPGGASPQAMIDSAEVVLVGGGGGPLVPAFTVPAAYFYVLGTHLPTQIGADQRFRMATRDNQERLLPILTAALDDGTLNPAPAINPAQAVRRLTALTPEATGLMHCTLDGSVSALVTDWLNFPNAANWRDYQAGDDPIKFWKPELAVQPLQYLHLDLCAITDNYAPLIAAILAIPVASIAALAALTEAQWKNLFGNPINAGLLPPFTAPGTDAARLAAFLRHVRKFFDLAYVPGALPSGTADTPPALDLPTNDAIAKFVTAYEALIGFPFTFGAGGLNAAQASAAAQTVFPADLDAQAWLVQRMQILNELCLLAGVVSSTVLPPVLNTAFSIAESLYARGFTSADDIKPLSLTDFTDALRGTVAFDSAGAIYAKAGAVGPPAVPPPGAFQPVNPGSLVNCIPPCYLSPLGPVQYLHELLSLSEASTCKNSFAPPPPGKKTLGDAIAERRGPLGTLLVTAANAETQIPLLDIVNENLEYLAATLPAAPKGAIYNTAGDAIDNHKICPAESDGSETCHAANILLETLPEHSSPAAAVAQPAAYDALKKDFSAPTLPYSQSLDLNRTYLEHFKTCRFETMRTFRKEITEFALDPTLPAPVFQSQLWRYPVRIDTAIEYLGITPEEYDLLFTKDIADVPTPGQLTLYELYGFDVPDPGGVDWLNIVLLLPEFLKRTGLTYCELVDLQKADCFTFVMVQKRGRDERQPHIEPLPDCEPCCLEHYAVHFTAPADPHEALRKLVVYLRLWRKSQAVCGAQYSFTELCDICEVLGLFPGANINPDFIRQLAAFQILRDQCRLRLTEGTIKPGSHGADRTHLLALWIGPGAAKWNWAVGHLLDRIQHFARKRHDECHCSPHFIKLLANNLDPLSVLAGFDPALPADTWNAKPTHTLRFAEILAKIYASSFGVGEILYLFTAEEHLDGDDPFPLQDSNEALDDPLGLPDDDTENSLWALRRKLLLTEVTEEEIHDWPWPRIEAALRHDFGYIVAPGATDVLLSLAQHFFPTILEHAGTPVSATDRQYRTPLAAPSPDLWNIPPDGPFRFAAAANQLWTQIPLTDHAVVEKLAHLRNLNPAEQQAVQDLYYQPRLDLARFACFFPGFAAAEKHLIEEPDESKRWHWFQRHFVLTYKRCVKIAEHLVRHVADATETAWHDGQPTVWLVLRRLFADENRALSDWEADSGILPNVTWKPLPSGGSFAALLGLTGTGLMGEFYRADGTLAWREVREPMIAFGHEKNAYNVPVPTLIPAMDFTFAPGQHALAELRNGIAIEDAHGRELGGAESFSVNWSGVLLVEEAGCYEFRAGAPTEEGKEPNFERAEHNRWRVTLSRGQKTWVVLNHKWHGEHGRIDTQLALKRGAYHITVEFVQPPPNFSGVDDIYPQHTGFQVKYAGPDTDFRLETLPLHRLFRDFKDDTLDTGVRLTGGGTAALFLKAYYTSTLRDIRRTYQRAFKALLFVHRFTLSGRQVMPYRQSELGYMLEHPDRFVGVSYFRNPVSFARHDVNFDFNFLPLKDAYHAPSPLQDKRVQPAPKRKQALFDWWERMFDYTQMRRARGNAIERPVWLLFEEALEKQPNNAAQLLRHLGVDFRHAPLVLHYFQGQANPVYAIAVADLEDDRWAVRIWHGDRWALRLMQHFNPFDIAKARPDLWASDDPAALVAGEAETGNANLSRFLYDGDFENGMPRRYTDVKIVNDRLRERARTALLAYLCGMNRVPLPWGGTAHFANDLSALLLLDVEAGCCERASRIEEAVTSVHNYLNRARLGLEPDWTVTSPFLRLWQHEFALFKVWEKCKCRSLYKENWIEWDELRKARKIEAFQFLEAELRRSTLTIAAPGGLEYWPETLPPVHPAVLRLQKREPSFLRLLTSAREGLGILGTPERDGRPSWLAPNVLPAEERPPVGRPGNPPGRGPAGRNPDNPNAIALPAPAADSIAAMPLWIQAAIRLGVKFIRVAAAGVPPAEAEFRPVDFKEEPGCCNECGCEHPPHLDEMYFWLVSSQIFTAQEQDEYYDPALQASGQWHDETALPKLLDWKSAPVARLAWCRVHNGEFMQPRRSDDIVPVTPGMIPDLTFTGRVADSLTFAVTNGVIPVGYTGKDAPGFRYDMAADACVALPLIADPPAALSTFPAGLPAYPYFVFVEPGDRLFPDSMFSPALSVAGVLRCHCRFEPALKWYQLFRNPLLTDNIWVHCGENILPPPPNIQGREGVVMIPPAMCCDSTQISNDDARNRAVLMHYLDTLLEWAQALLRQNSRESAQQSRLILDTAARILGPCPPTVINHTLPAAGQTVADFVALIPPLNPRLLEIYGRVKDGLVSVHRCLSDTRLRNAAKGCRAPYWGQEPCSCGSLTIPCGCQILSEPCCDDEDGCFTHSPYRFIFLMQKAQEAAVRVRELGSALLAAFERGDAEYMASMQARHESQLADLTIKVRQDQWRDSDWQVTALGKTKEISITNRQYYKRLIEADLNTGELNYQSNTNSSIDLQTSAIPIEVTGEVLRLIPDVFVGTSGVNVWLPLGTKLGDMFQAIARIIDEEAKIADTNASLDLKQADWQRRREEWVHQVEILDIEIEQIEVQILGAERRRNEALEELNLQQLASEQARERLNTLRDKFTNHELTLYFQKETAALYGKMYMLTRHLAAETQRAMNFELGYTRRNFLPCEDWDNLHEGLLAGERLQLALQRMESEYIDCNHREYELTKPISLAMHFPLQFLQLKITGCCEIEIPEWLFDKDYPGQFMRRIKNVSLTIPCVTGPYTGVHCRLTLLSSQTRINPALPCPVMECCSDRPVNDCGCHHTASEHYSAGQGDARIIRHYGAREAIATSSARNDAGLFELNFRDERYLPFEFYGSAGCWRIEMPPENNNFDMDSVSDVVLLMNHTAHEGGDALRSAARAACREKLPGNGWVLFDIRKDFPDIWEQFRQEHKSRRVERSMTLKITRKLFPFLPGDPTLKITKLAVLLEGESRREHSCPEIDDCACAHASGSATHLVEVTVNHPDDDRDDSDELEMVCTSSADWPNLYHGMGNIAVGPISKHHKSPAMTLTFDDTFCALTRLFLLCQYEIAEGCCKTVRPITRGSEDC